MLSQPQMHLKSHREAHANPIHVFGPNANKLLPPSGNCTKGSFASEHSIQEHRPDGCHNGRQQGSKVVEAEDLW